MTLPASVRPRGRRLRTPWVAVCVVAAVSSASGAVGDDHYTPLSWSGGGVAHQATPQQVCSTVAAWWGWDRSGFTYTTEFVSNGQYRCQRYFQGTREPAQYVNVTGDCQRHPATIVTGSDWSYPWYDSSHNAPCYCYSPKKFDRRSEWCTAHPSCTWYPNNSQTECGHTVGRLLAVSKATTDPTRIFHQTQSCIAKASCDARCKMDNCNWLKAVIPDFVDPYLQRRGDWQAIEADCARGIGWISGRRCAARMAEYHIEVDLAVALAKSGCGTESDWTKVFEIIDTCSAQSFGHPIESFVASRVVRALRDRVRATCLVMRRDSGVDALINADLRGTTCIP